MTDVSARTFTPSSHEKSLQAGERTAVTHVRHPIQRTTKDVRSDPAEPQETVIGQRPGVVRVPTFHVQLTRPPIGFFGYRPWACDGPLL